MPKEKTKYQTFKHALTNEAAQALGGTLKDLGVDEEEATLKRVWVDGTEKGVELEEGSRTAIQYVSTRSIDRDGDILMPKGAILSEFKKAPQVLWGHDYSIPPIGSDLSIKADGWGLLAKTQYATTPLASEVFTLKQEGHLKTSSVGFIPVERSRRGDDGFDKTLARLSKGHPEIYADTSGVNSIINKWLVLEHSDVSVPANPDALSLAVSKGLTLVSEKMAKDLGLDIDFEGMETEGDLEEKDAAVLAEANYDVLMASSEPHQISAKAHWAQLALWTLKSSIRECEGQYGDGIKSIYGADDNTHATELIGLEFDADRFSPAEADEWLKRQSFDVLEFREGETKKAVVVTPHVKLVIPQIHVKVISHSAPEESISEYVKNEVKYQLDMLTGKV